MPYYTLNTGLQVLPTKLHCTFDIGEGAADRSDFIPTPPFTVRGMAVVTWAELVVAVTGKLVEIVAVEAPVTLAAGLVVVINGDTTATGVLLGTEADTSGVAIDETTDELVTALTIPAVLTPGAADLDICITEDGIVDSAAVALAMLTTACTGVGAESVAVNVVVVGLVTEVVSAAVFLTSGALVVGKLGFITVAGVVTVCGT